MDSWWRAASLCGTPTIHIAICRPGKAQRRCPDKLGNRACHGSADPNACHACRSQILFEKCRSAGCNRGCTFWNGPWQTDRSRFPPRRGLDQQGCCRAFVAAVDIPSGLLADSPVIPGPAVKAHLTVTFSALKLAHVVPPASDYAGRIVLVPIGSPPALFENPEYRLNLVDRCRFARPCRAGFGTAIKAPSAMFTWLQDPKEKAGRP